MKSALLKAGYTRLPLRNTCRTGRNRTALSQLLELELLVKKTKIVPALRVGHSEYAYYMGEAKQRETVLFEMYHPLLNQSLFYSIGGTTC